MVPLNDLRRQYERLKPAIEEAVARVLASGWYILGPEVEAFEHEFAAFRQARYGVGVASGTDALEIGLRALGLSPGDEVLTTANAGMYSVTAIRAVGAIPVFVDTDPRTMTMDPAALSAATTPRSRAVIVTHLYGRMAHLRELVACAEKHYLALVEDCVQAHGAEFDGRPAGSWGSVGCFSFYPTKNLGALGDGGAVVTSDAQVAQRARWLRQYGWVAKYEAHIPGGRNSRLDELQAAVLRAKLPHLDEWNLDRRRVADRYDAALDRTALELPAGCPAGEMVCHLYVVRAANRGRLQASLQRQRIGCGVHYPIPDHLQRACADLGYRAGALPHAERAAAEVLSLPCFAELTAGEADRVIAAVKAGVYRG